MSTFAHCTGKDLIFFDIDDTLITAVDPTARATYPMSFRLALGLHHPQLLFRSTWEYYYSMFWQQTQRVLIEPAIIYIINTLKGKGCTVLGLTSMETGSYGVIKNFPQWRIDMLNGFGLEFSRGYPDHVFTTLPFYRNNYPILYKGILYCNQQPKGIVAGAFLDAFSVHPRTITFFDDDEENLRSVADACAERNIPFHGFLYLRKLDLPGKWDPKRALAQFDYLIQHQKWLPDEEYPML